MPLRRLVVAALLAATLLIPVSAEAAPGIQGTVPQLGFGLLITTEESSPDGVVASLAQDGCAAVALGVFPGGAYVGYVPGAPAFVNAAFPDTLAAGSVFVVRCFPAEPAAPASSSLADLPEYAVYQADVGVCTWVFARFPQSAFESGAGVDGRLAQGSYHQALGKGLLFEALADAEARGIVIVDGAPANLSTDLSGCESSDDSWAAVHIGDGLSAFKQALDASGIFLDASALGLIESTQGVTLTAEVRAALAD